ncbi:hypothetical protein DDZ18_13155 [Marinicauda salina]|uniref:ZIP family metal transporter n=1 Tax=Marinicauda salina TaxID=2135793 RepID=A0A2U2BQT4_9PROT|nr:ZIP family metal transporter [Marinicauda salina]PWE16365.1 hypothetical protein DDZ18_13155 [Marinicauda salina]
MSPVLASALFGLAAAAVTVIALVMVRFAAGFTRTHAPVFAAFAAGLVIAVSILRLLPEALDAIPAAPWLVLAGFGLGAMMQRLLSLRGPAGLQAASSLAPVLAIALHSLIDGVVYAVTFAVGAAIGLAAVPGLVIHEFPEAVICFVLLQRAGLSDRASAGYASLAAGGTTLLTAVAAAPVAASLSPEVLGGLFAVAAGLLLHVGAVHLLRHTETTRWTLSTPAVLGGAALAAAMTLMHTPPARDLDTIEVGGHFHQHAAN